jgi:hypothetical protein
MLGKNLFDDFEKCVECRQSLENCEPDSEIPTLCKFSLFIKNEVKFQGGKEARRKVVKAMEFSFKKYKSR